MKAIFTIFAVMAIMHAHIVQEAASSCETDALAMEKNAVVMLQDLQTGDVMSAMVKATQILGEVQNVQTECEADVTGALDSVVDLYLAEVPVSDQSGCGTSAKSAVTLFQTAVQQAKAGQMVQLMATMMQLQTVAQTVAQDCVPKNQTSEFRKLQVSAEAQCSTDVQGLTADVMDIYHMVKTNSTNLMEVIQDIEKVLTTASQGMSDCANLTIENYYDLAVETVLSELTVSNNDQCESNAEKLYDQGLKVYNDVQAGKFSIQTIIDLTQLQSIVSECQKDCALTNSSSTLYFDTDCSSQVDNVLSVLKQDYMSYLSGSLDTAMIMSSAEEILGNVTQMNSCSPSTVAEGVLMFAETLVHVNDIQACTADLEKLEQQAVNLFEDLKDGQLTQVIQAVSQVIQLTQTMKTDCAPVGMF